LAAIQQSKAIILQPQIKIKHINILKKHCHQVVSPKNYDNLPGSAGH